MSVVRGLVATTTALSLYIAGQPNVGKSSIFNLLTGGQAHVGNWAGVTVERKTGRLALRGGFEVAVTDLPGAYGLKADTIEEKVTRDVLLEGSCDLILDVVEANTLERQLYLTFQLLALRKPMILVVTMTDELKESGVVLDLGRLSELLGVECLPVNGKTGEGIERLKLRIAETARANACGDSSLYFPPSLTERLSAISAVFAASQGILGTHADFFALMYLLGDRETRAASLSLASVDRVVIGDSPGLPPPGESSPFVEAIDLLHGAAKGIAKEIASRETARIPFRERVTRTLDQGALSNVFGIPIFFAVLFAMFTITFTLGDVVIGYLESGFSFLAESARLIPFPMLSSLIADGVISGSGSVLSLAPYVFFMFLILSFLEDSGYMARAAFVMDRFMHRLGLHGKAFIPLVLGFGCNVPAIMAARTLESERDRIKVALMVPFTACSARLPVFVVFAGAFFGKAAAFVVLGLYALGMLASLFTAFLLSKTMLKGSSPGLVMELPPYRLPSLRALFANTWMKTKGYVTKAGTMIVAASVVLWALSYFPAGVRFGGEESFLGILGKAITPVFAPLGFDYRMTVGLVVGFAAKELVLSTLAVFSGGADLASSLPLMMTPLTSLAYLVFLLLYTPCLATVAVMRSETNSWKWTMFSVGYGLALAYLAAFAVKAIELLLH